MVKVINISGPASYVTSTRDGMMYAYLTLVVSLLSLTGGIGIIVLYFAYKELRTYARQLLVYLSLMDATIAFGNILGVIWVLYRDGFLCRNMTYCQFHSALTIFSSIGAFCWTTVMALCLFMNIVCTNLTFTARYMKVFHLVSWGLPSVVTITAWSSDVLGYDHNITQASWCWIDPLVPNAIVWQLFTGKVWEFTCSLLTTGLSFVVVVYIRRKAKTSLASKSNRKSKKAAIESANRKLMFVPLVFILCRIWGTIRFFIGNFAPEYADKPEVKWIVPMQGIGDSAQGFVNFVVYCCMTDAIRRRLFKCCMCCIKRSVDPAPPTITLSMSHKNIRSLAPDNN
ncbi:G-protein coupled receptor 157-like [Ylistrum balloti]|uniref:G-protein coupled receptor 157-like n=1 Tax=Ylistrum balloti TaxID=509963 RepID=UPI002905EE87|nr:G-protein coupled receptor 157-like [Ylistrum balloti]